jgi:hypothetical protein
MEKVKPIITNNCQGCKRVIDEETVKLRRIVTNDYGKFEKFCTDCVMGTVKNLPDVWYGYGSGTHTEENIADPATGKPIPFSSKQGKWEAMQKAGVRECGDKIHGARTNFTR